MKHQDNIIHEDVVAKVREEMPDTELIYEVSELFKVFGDFTRTRIMCALNISEMCVYDLAAILNMTQSAVSHQLRILRGARIVKSRRSGKVVFYSLDDEHIRDLFNIIFIHIQEE